MSLLNNLHAFINLHEYSKPFCFMQHNRCDRFSCHILKMVYVLSHILLPSPYIGKYILSDLYFIGRDTEGPESVQLSCVPVGKKLSPIFRMKQTGSLQLPLHPPPPSSLPLLTCPSSGGLLPASARPKRNAATRSGRDTGQSRVSL